MKVVRNAFHSPRDLFCCNVLIAPPPPLVPLQDSAFEFEKRRNKPVKYDRELMAATLDAMKRVGEVASTREKRFYAKRMEGVKGKEKVLRALEVAKSIDLVRPAVTRKTQEVNVAAAVKVKAKAGAKMDSD